MHVLEVLAAVDNKVDETSEKRLCGDCRAAKKIVSSALELLESCTSNVSEIRVRAVQYGVHLIIRLGAVRA